jgi:hypothetical protein
MFIKKFKTGDIFLVIIILIAGMYFLFTGNLNRYIDKEIVIRADKKIIKEHFSKKVRKIKINGARGFSVIEIGSNWVRMSDSDCPNKLCVKQGKIYKVGDSVICLPNKVSITIAGRNKKTEEEVDAVCH